MNNIIIENWITIIIMNCYYNKMFFFNSRIDAKLLLLELAEHAWTVHSLYVVDLNIHIYYVGKATSAEN